MGISTTYPASPAILDMTPRNTTMGVMILRGVSCTVFFSRAPIQPLDSATPTPSMATRTTPRGAKPVKLETACSSIYTIPLRLNRLFTSMFCVSISPVVRLIRSPTSEKPAADRIPDRTTIPTAKSANRAMGWGSLFPTLSTPFKNRLNSDGFFCFVASFFITLPP